MTRLKELTAHDFLAQRRAGPPNPVVSAQLARAAEERRTRQLQYERAAAPLVADLHAVGYPVSSVWDLVNIHDDYPEALPVLVAHLTKPYPSVIRDGIARALVVGRAIFAWDLVYARFLTEPDRAAKDGLAVALLRWWTVITCRRCSPCFATVGMARVVSCSFAECSGCATEELADDPDLRKQIAIIRHRKQQRAARKD